MISRIRLYLLPKRKLCEGCGKDLSKEKATVCIFQGQPFVFCEPHAENKCFFNWYNMHMTPDGFRFKGLM